MNSPITDRPAGLRMAALAVLLGALPAGVVAAAHPEEMGHYRDELWVLGASDGPERYMDWGAPRKNPRLRPWRGVDGTLVPSAPGGSLAFQPDPTNACGHCGRRRRSSATGSTAATGLPTPATRAPAG